MKSRRRNGSRWERCNAPAALRRRRAAADARREAAAAELPPVYAGPAPLSAWQTVQVLDHHGVVRRTIALYVPMRGRCDQHAAEIDGQRCDHMVTATEIGRVVAACIVKRPSVAMLAEWRRE